MVADKRIVVNWKHPPNRIFNAGPEWGPVTSSHWTILEKCKALVTLFFEASVECFNFILLFLRHMHKGLGGERVRLSQIMILKKTVTVAKLDNFLLKLRPLARCAPTR
jgi:hypothetical protein